MRKKRDFLRNIKTELNAENDIRRVQATVVVSKLAALGGGGFSNMYSYTMWVAVEELVSLTQI